MNKYEKQIRELKKEYDDSYNEYVREIGKAYREAQEFCLSYNDQIARINATRDNLLDGISILYKFLKIIGSVGPQISAFSYATESSRFVDKEVYHASRFENDNYSTSGFAKTASVAAIVAAPVLLPGIWIGDSLGKRSKDKKEYERMIVEYEEEKAKWEKAIKDKKRKPNFTKMLRR
jgi:hypothetical protein